MDKLERIQTKQKRLRKRINKLWMKMQLLQIQEYAITDTSLLNELYPNTKQKLNSLYGKMVYVDTDTVKNVSHETLEGSKP